ncbi:MAG: hypothetical protein GY722_02335 [bacterium]|nr:hypothetical protein [bacterium]
MAALLALAPSAIGYVACVGQPNEAMSQDVARLLSDLMKVLEAPSQLLWPDGRFPAFWHEHLRAEYFWQTVGRYFFGNFFSWWLIMISLSIVFTFSKSLLARSRASGR